MAPRKKKTATEMYFFSGTAIPETNADLCSINEMPIPERIAKHPVKKQLWDFIVADMEHRKCLSVTYNLLISELVETVHLMYVCRESLDTQGLVIDKVDGDGNYMSTVVNPYQTILSRQQTHLIKLLEKTGMSPRDITYLVNPEATSSTPIIEAGAADYARITYFR